jgi:DNA polymerase (family X)
LGKISSKVNQLDKHELVRIFSELGLLLELKGENPFKSRAYYNAARSLENLDEDLSVLIQEGRLCQIPGFGDALVKKITEWAQTGAIAYYENHKSSIPEGFLELMRIPGLGPKKINQIYHSLDITNISQLEQACRDNRLAALPGFGVKTQSKICAGIKFIQEHLGEHLLLDALIPALELRDALAKYPEVHKVEIAGSLRRLKAIVHDLDLVTATNDPNGVAEFFKGLPLVEQVTTAGDTKISVVLKSGISVDLRIVKPQEFPHALQHFSGSKEHNTKLRHIAKQLGYKVNEYGLFREQEDQPEYCQDEAGIYQKLGMSYIAPELREDLGEIEAAQKDQLPILVRPEDLKGIFHVHTTDSDGGNTLPEMVKAAIESGYSYLGVSDHSQTAVFAHGLTIDALKKQWAEIETLGCQYPDFKIFKGIEADILPDGELDYCSEILAQFDFVIGSVHSHFRMERSEMTARILKAMDSPYLTILGHPTGRILLERSGYEIDLDQIIEKAAKRGIVLEFNASPFRFDLDWRWCKIAKERGALISINPDAHNCKEIGLVTGGVMVARKGWLEAKDVLNTKDQTQIISFLSERKINH